MVEVDNNKKGDGTQTSFNIMLGCYIAQSTLPQLLLLKSILVCEDVPKIYLIWYRTKISNFII